MTYSQWFKALGWWTTESEFKSSSVFFKKILGYCNFLIVIFSPKIIYCQLLKHLHSSYVTGTSTLIIKLWFEEHYLPVGVISHLNSPKCNSFTDGQNNKHTVKQQVIRNIYLWTISSFGSGKQKNKNLHLKASFEE